MGLGRCVGRRGGWKERVNKRHESYALCGKKLGRSWEEVGNGDGSRCERLHGKLDDGDRRDVQQFECVNNLQPFYEIVGCQLGATVLNTWNNPISHRCPPIRISEKSTDNIANRKAIR